MDEDNWSGLSEEEIGDLAEEIIAIVCRERPNQNNKLESSRLRDMLIEEGTHPPDFAMLDVLDRLRPVLVIPLGGPQNPHTDPGARIHGGVTIYGFDCMICDR